MENLILSRVPIFPAFFQNNRHLLLLCLAVLFAYASVWPNSFVFDDEIIIVHNSFIRHWNSLPQLLTSYNFKGGGGAQGFYRPIPMLLYFIVYQIFDATAAAFHALNTGLHIINACLLYTFGLRAQFNKGASLAAALLWAVHPIHTDDVAYISSTPELLWSGFCLIGLISLLPDFTPAKIGRALVFFLLALGCKESAVVFPALAVIALFFVSKGRAKATAYLKLWPLWLLAAVYIISWIIYMHMTGYTLDMTGNADYFRDYMHNIGNRILTYLAALSLYARLIVWPQGLHIEWDMPVFTSLFNRDVMIGTALALLGLSQILWGRTRHGFALSFGLLWFAVAQSAYTGIALPLNARFSEGWMYMPLMGFFLGAAETIAPFFKKKPDTGRALVCAAALCLGAVTFLQNETWRNTETLYLNIKQHGGSVSELSGNIGLYYLSRGEFDKALAQAQDEINHPDDRAPSLWARPHAISAMALLKARPDSESRFTPDIVRDALPSAPHIPEAIRELGQALEANPDDVWLHQALAVIYRYQGNGQMAAFHENRAESLLEKGKNS